MNIFGYTISIHKTESTEYKKKVFLDRAESNARLGLMESCLELRHHGLLLEQLKVKLVGTPEEQEKLDREIRLTTEAIERDKKSINNWETQIRAINHERGNE